MQGAGVQGVLLIALGTVTETSEPYPPHALLPVHTYHLVSLNTQVVFHSICI